MSYITAAWQISLDRLDVDIFPLLSENHTCGSQVSPLSSISDQPFSIQFSTPKNAIKQDPDTYNQLSVCRDKVRWMNSIRVGAVSLSFFQYHSIANQILPIFHLFSGFNSNSKWKGIFTFNSQTVPLHQNSSTKVISNAQSHKHRLLSKRETFITAFIVRSSVPVRGSSDIARSRLSIYHNRPLKRSGPVFHMSRMTFSRNWTICLKKGLYSTNRLPLPAAFPKRPHDQRPREPGSATMPVKHGPVLTTLKATHLF